MMQRIKSVCVEHKLKLYIPDFFFNMTVLSLDDNACARLGKCYSV